MHSDVCFISVPSELQEPVMDETPEPGPSFADASKCEQDLPGELSVSPLDGTPDPGPLDVQLSTSGRRSRLLQCLLNSVCHSS